MRKEIWLLISILIGLNVSAQIYEEGFDDFTSGDYLAVVDSENWITWADLPGTDQDATVSNMFSETAPNSVLVTGTTDIIFLCGEHTSGSFYISFDYYIPSSKAGYFNMQHIFASSWALETFFHADGTSRIFAAGQEFTSHTYPQDIWFNITVEVDLDEDLCTMYWVDEEIISFQWSLQIDGLDGPNQLGCVNLFAGTEGSDAPLFHFDNFTFDSLSSSLDPPTIELNVEEITVSVNDDNIINENINISNIGEQDLIYNIYPTFNVPSASGTGSGQLSYCGEFEDGIGGNDPVSRKVAVLFQPAMIDAYIGMELSSIEFYLEADVLDFEAKVWAAGSTTTPGPGEEIISMDFDPNVGEWNIAQLSNSVLLDGNPIWIGAEYFQPANTYAFGTDEGPITPGVNWTSAGPGWSEITVDGNLNIRANVTGDPFNTFLDVSVDNGILLPANNIGVNVLIDPADLAFGQYTGEIVIASNDPNSNYARIDITLDVITSLNDDANRDAVLVYPSPATDKIYVKSNSTINEVEISNYIGQLLNLYSIGDKIVEINVSTYKSGVYFIKVSTTYGVHTIKIIKK